jgi:formylglycine-generating enzyme required for sulfatase activity
MQKDLVWQQEHGMMSKLPIPHNTSSLQPSSRRPASETREGEPDVERLVHILRRLEVMERAASDENELQDLRQVIQEVKALLAEARRRAVSEVPLPPESRDHNKTSGTVVGVVGGGSASFSRGVAGRDYNAGNVMIDHVDQVVVSLDGQSPPTAAVSEMERDYLLWLREKASRVPLGKLDMQMAMPNQTAPDIRLNEIYVPLDIMRTQTALNLDNAPADRVPVPLMDAVNNMRRLVILGDPGSGKTSFLNYLTLCLVGARLYPDRGFLGLLDVPREGRRRAVSWRYGALLPVFVELREFVRNIPSHTEGTAKLIWTHIIDQLESHNLGDYTSEILHALRQGKALVLFDGLDEVVDPQQRRVVRDAVTDFAGVYAQSRYIVTCRELSYTNPAWQLTSFPPVKLAPLSQSSIDLFIDKWYTALAKHSYLEPQQAQLRAHELREAAAHLSDLAQNPMLLTVMSVVHTYKGTLPRERARLYNDCVQLLLWEWQQAKSVGYGAWERGIVEILETREERLINGLCEVAFRAHSAQDSSGAAVNIPQGEVLRTLQHYLDEDWGKAQKFCDYVEKRAGLLIGKGQQNNGEQVFSFPHRGFQEFLAARHIVSDREFSRLVATLAAKGDIWHEVLLLAIGHLVFNQQDVYRPLNAINLLCKPQAPTSAAAWRAVWWAAEMLLIVGLSVARQDEYIGQDVVPRLLEQLTQLVKEGRLTPSERAKAADTLGLLGDPRAGVCSLEPEMVLIQGGPFKMGLGDERHEVVLRPFYIARYPVTNAQYRLFLADPDYNTARYWTQAGLEWRNGASRPGGYVNDPRLGIDNRPVVGITWYEALAYTNWLRYRTRKPYRLLTEAEWERAAAGQEGRRYPFGSRASDDTFNTREANIGQTTAVGMFPQDCTPEGVYDMGGNVWEWCSSLSMNYPYRRDDGREVLNVSGPRILRGGAYDNLRRQIHCTSRRPVEPQARVSLIGFRVARDG